MHALRQFIQEQMDARGWRPADLVRASGLSKQLVSNHLNDDREVLAQRPSKATVTGYARAFKVSEDVVLSKVAAAMGVPIGDLQPVVFSVSDASDAELLAELARRLSERAREGGHGGDTAPKTEAVTVLQIPGRHGEQIWMATTNPDPSLDMLRQAQELASEVTQGGDQAPSSKEGKPKHGNTK